MSKLCLSVIAVLTSYAAPAQDPPAAMSGEDRFAAQWKQVVLEADHLQTNGALDEALKGFGTALEMARSRGEESSYFGLTLSRMAVVYLDQAKYQQAAVTFSRALTNLENSLGPEHMHVANCLSALGTCYRSLGRYAEAESVSTRALAIAQKAGGSADIAAALISMGLLYTERSVCARYGERPHVPGQCLPATGPVPGRGADSAPRLARGHSCVGPGTWQVAHLECGPAVIESARGQSRDAEARLRRALPILEATLGAIPIWLLFSLAWRKCAPTGPLCGGGGHPCQHDFIAWGYARAEPLWRRALTIFLRTVGENDMRTASALTGLAIDRAK